MEVTLHEHNDLPNNRKFDCLFNSLFRIPSRNAQLRNTGFWKRNPLVICDSATKWWKSVSMLWRHPESSGSCHHGHNAPPHSRLAPSQWETSLQSNAVSHWLGANLESVLITSPHTCPSSFLVRVTYLGLAGRVVEAGKLERRLVAVDADSRPLADPCLKLTFELSKNAIKMVYVSHYLCNDRPD